VLYHEIQDSGMMALVPEMGRCSGSRAGQAAGHIYPFQSSWRGRTEVSNSDPMGQEGQTDRRTDGRTDRVIRKHRAFWKKWMDPEEIE